MTQILKFLLEHNKNSLRIVDYKITRKTFFPDKLVIAKCKHYLKSLLKKNAEK